VAEQAYGGESHDHSQQRHFVGRPMHSHQRCAFPSALDGCKAKTLPRGGARKSSSINRLQSCFPAIRAPHASENLHLSPVGLRTTVIRIGGASKEMRHRWNSSLRTGFSFVGRQLRSDWKLLLSRQRTSPFMREYAIELGVSEAAVICGATANHMDLRTKHE
jgi:hypothetical protein